MPMVSAQAKVQFKACVFEVTIPFGGVARQRHTFSKWNNDPFFVQFASFKIHGVDKEIACVPEISYGGGKETLGREHGVLIPAFDTEALQGCEGVKASGLKVAIKNGLARPTDLRKLSVRLQQWTCLS